MARISKSAAKAAYRRRVTAALKRADEAFRGKYSDDINELLGLSRDDIDDITPDGTDLQIYDELIEVVKEASRVNLEQAELVNRIEAMGEVAVQIAKKVPRFAALFV